MAVIGFDNVKDFFESKVEAGLGLCGVDFSHNIKIGAAVSGGADSVSLLYSLANILKNKSENSGFDFCLDVITVNHYMRPKEETCGDVAFVQECCRNLNDNGFNVSCTVAELKPGAIGETAMIRQSGAEDAARFLRYGAFERFIEEKNVDFLCLAHNKNDNIETILMRFIQGSNVDAGGGISGRRGKFIRPLINISRNEIEEYLNFLGIGWCNDKTNNDTNYLRNNIRHNLIPFLNNNFSGWEKAVSSGAEKAVEDAEIIKSVTDSFNVSIKKAGDVFYAAGGAGCSGCAGCAGGAGCAGVLETDGTLEHDVEYAFFDRNDFEKLLPGVQKRVLIKACNYACNNSRISNTFLKDVIHSVMSAKGQEFSKFYSDIEISVKKDIVFVKKYIKKDTDLVFFDIIEENGIYDFPFGRMSVTFSNSVVYVSINGCHCFFNGEYPICVRNGQIGDEIKCSSGKMKKVADIYSDWHVANSDKKMIPVISCLENGFEKIKCILAAFLGYKDWIVK